MQLPLALVPFAAEPVLPRNPVAADFARLPEAVEAVLLVLGALKQTMEAVEPLPLVLGARLPEAVEPVERWRRRPLAGLKQAVLSRDRVAANFPGILSGCVSCGPLEAAVLVSGGVSSGFLEAVPLQAMQLVMIDVGGKSTPRPAIPPRPSTCIQDIHNGSRSRPPRYC
jgi:hypothetical protein